MKVLIAVSCFLAVASAGIVGLGHSAYAYPQLSYAGVQHLPVIGANGVPVDEPAVQVARAEHAAAHIEASARNGDYAVVGHVAGPVAYAAEHLVYNGPQHLPVIGADGVPVDEPAVQARRAEHAAAYVEASVRNGDAVLSHVAAPVAYAGQYLAGPAVGVVPAETPEVAAARAAHYAAHAEVQARNHYAPLVHYRRRRSAVHGYASPLVYSAHIASPVYAGPQHLPVIGSNGVPIDEASVQIARANHAVARAEAQVRNGDGVVISAHAAPVAVAHSAHLVASHVASPVYAGPQHLPVIGSNGVPVDEASVQIARANHAVARAEAQVRNGDGVVVAAPVAVAHSAHLVASHVSSPVYAGPQHLPVIGANGVPVDEPAVQVARANHAAQHLEASVRNGEAAVVAGQVAVAHSGHLVASQVASSVYSGPQHLPVIGANGVPVDEAAVQIARANHAAQHVEASVRNGDAAIVAGPVAVAHSGQLVASHVASPVYAGPQHLPVIGANGVPVDEAAVQIARANHAAQYVEASARNGEAAWVSAPVAYAAQHIASPVVSHVGVSHISHVGSGPVETHEVAVARAAHAAAHVEAQARNGELHYASPVVQAW